MKNRRLKQFGASLLVVLSLLASSVSAACTCSHEPETVENLQTKTEEHAAHSHSHEAKIATHRQETASPEIASTFLSESDCRCLCAESAPRVFAKAENVRIEKYQAAVLSSQRIEIDLTRQEISIKTVDFVTPFYLSDSFHNLTPGRAPPRL